jgi:hypothetical protein
LQPCWGAAAGAQQLLEPGLAWASGACAAAALQQVPKPAILAAVGELVLRVEEEMARQAAARQHGVQQVTAYSRSSPINPTATFCMCPCFCALLCALVFVHLCTAPGCSPQDHLSPSCRNT